MTTVTIVETTVSATVAETLVSATVANSLVSAEVSTSTVEAVVEAEVVNAVVEEAIVYAAVVGIQGPPGVSGGGDGQTGIYTYGETISALKAVVLIDGEAFVADSTTIAHRGRVAGVTESAANAGNDGTVRFLGPMSDPSWNWTGPLLFVGSAGGLVETPPSGFSQAIARVESSDTIFVNPFQPIERA